MKRSLKFAAVAIVVVAIGVWAFRTEAVPADFAMVTRGSLEVTVNEEGRTRVRDRYVVSAPVPGRMARIELEPGDEVVGGKTVLARFQPSDPALLDARTRAELEARLKATEAALGGARADRERARAELAFARSELQRAQKLLADRVISARELEAAQRQAEIAERALQSAEFAVRTAEYQLAQARASLSRDGRADGAPIPLRSPVSGVVLRRLQESEAVVATGQPLLEVGNLDNLEIVTDLLSSAAVRVSPGQPVSIEQWGGGRPLRGRVRRVEPSGFTKISALGVEEQRVNAIIDFDEPRQNRASLGDGYRVEVRIVVSAREDVLKVPVSSLLRHGSDWAVYAVDDGRAVRRVVQVGERNALEAEITAGLSEGETVIVYPSDAVSDGVKVKPRS